jgi:hypothetical protein
MTDAYVTCPVVRGLQHCGSNFTLSRSKEPIREVLIHDEELATRRLSMMRIMARWMNAPTVLANDAIIIPGTYGALEPMPCQPRNARLRSSVSSRSVLARRCLRDTATLDA